MPYTVKAESRKGASKKTWIRLRMSVAQKDGKNDVTIGIFILFHVPTNTPSFLCSGLGSGASFGCWATTEALLISIRPTLRIACFNMFAPFFAIQFRVRSEKQGQASR
jgi:hypothetical protein